MKPNQFEKAILDAAVAAQEFHIEMTEGHYLWYSHESFLQNFIAIKMFKNKKKAGHYVYIDASPKKIRESSDFASEKLAKNSRQRFDLVFWFKSKNEVKAIVEIKETWGKKPVMDDIDKVSKHLKTEDGQGYVLYYTDHKGQDREVIQDRFYEIEKQSRPKVELRADYIRNPRDGDPWGFALFRVVNAN